MKQIIKTKYLRLILTSLLIITTALLGGCTSVPGALPKEGEDLAQKGIIKGQVEILREDSIKFSTAQLPATPISSQKTGYSKKDNVIFSSGIEKAEDKPQNTYLAKFNKQTGRKYIYNNILTIANGVIKGSVKELSDNTYKFKLKPEKITSFKKKADNYSSLKYIEPDYRIKIQAVPNDPYYSEQWNLEMLNLAATWNKFKGSQEVQIAVVDTGIITDHPDLEGNIGPGYDVIDKDRDPSDPSPGFSHGTQVAGIIGAVTDNSTGIAGINWNIEIMPVRVMDENGNGIVSNLTTGIRWAADNGADIINLSLASSGPSATLKDAVQYAVDKGVTVVASSGNNGREQVSYPARYSSVISVGAIGPTKKKAYYSNYGEKLDLVAPGGDSTVNTNHNNTILTTAGSKYPYHSAQGTSMAAPHVSGLAALLISSGTTSPADIQKRLKNTATPLDQSGMKKDYYGAGLVNINQALGIKTKDDGNKDNDKQKQELNITDIQLFTVESGENKEISNPTLKTNPAQDGRFALSSPPGQRKLIAWLDLNKDNKINKGDYYTEKIVYVSQGKTISKLNLELKKVK